MRFENSEVHITSQSNEPSSSPRCVRKKRGRFFLKIVFTLKNPVKLVLFCNEDSCHEQHKRDIVCSSAQQ